MLIAPVGLSLRQVRNQFILRKIRCRRGEDAKNELACHRRRRHGRGAKETSRADKLGLEQRWQNQPQTHFHASSRQTSEQAPSNLRASSEHFRASCEHAPSKLRASSKQPPNNPRASPEQDPRNPRAAPLNSDNSHASTETLPAVRRPSREAQRGLTQPQ